MDPEGMTRRAFACAATACLARAASPRKPNIVLIVADDLGYGELGCQGNPQIATPNIDSIAHKGVRFTNGYVSAPVCSPSRAGLMTGRYQTRFGHELNAIGKQNLAPHVGLPLTETTLATALQRAGYATGIVGKWHLGGSAPYHPRNRGFDEFYGFLHEGHSYVPASRQDVVSHLRNPEPPYDEENPVRRGGDAIEEPEYLTRAFTREALSFIGRHRSAPFFLYLAYNAVHSPMQALAEDARKFPKISDPHRRVFAGMLSSMDDGVGQVLNQLRTLYLEQDTLIFFLSDNGGPTEELTSSNLPLRGGKGQLYEGGIRIPFLMQWKGHVTPNTVQHRPVISLDISATILHAAGLPTRGDGLDLLSAGSRHDSLFWRYGQNCAVRRGNWKLVRQFERGKPDAPWQLFDLGSDIGETRDLAADRPALARELEQQWRSMNEQMVKPLW